MADVAICRACGSRLKTDAQFCQRCGTGIDRRSTPDMATSPGISKTPTHRDSRTWITIGERDRRVIAAAQAFAKRYGLAVLAVAGLAIAGCFLVTASVPDLTGLSPQVAAGRLSANYLHMGNPTYYGIRAMPSVAGTVMSQSPAGGSRVRRGSVVNAVLAGLQPVFVPQLRGMTLTEAKAALDAVPLGLGNVTSADVSTVSADTVLESSPAPGTPLQRAADVDIVVALGPDVVVPNFVGMSVTEAQSLASKKRLSLAVLGTAPFARVLRQDPKPGTKTRPRVEVRIWPRSVPPTPIDPEQVGNCITTKGSEMMVSYHSLPLSSGNTLLSYAGWRFIVMGSPTGIKQGDLVRVRVDGSVDMLSGGSATDVTILEVVSR